ncbi:platelet-activating factor acetylhydrolase-like [Daphnia pulicaria]|uniref:platelet-activating factor acetylhydrolase-like n=1 Tax=Daphnia pulicaria TaxID=35523 RepID=UPI001EE9F9B8|nr:platelet-activating factor acetylhydrolase-like [Daphnia pulicaria]
MELPHCYQGKTHVPAPSGKYVVGCTDIITGPDSQNGCLFRMFYPTKLNDIYENSSSWAKYLPHDKYVEGYATAGGFKIHFVGKKIISWSFGNAYIPAVEDAEPSDEQLFPVIVFSHGLKACRTSYSSFCSDISSHGFIVAAIEHRDGSACVSYTLEKGPNSQESPAVKWIPYNPVPFETDEMPFRHEQLEIRTRECSQTLELLSKLNEGSEIEHILQPTMDLAKFKGVMELSSPTIAGHSFGSTTVLRTLNADKRFKIGLAMDAWMWPLRDEPELAKSVEQPLLFINSEAFQTAANLETMKRFTVDADHTERRVVTLKGSVHYSQNDVPSLLPWYIRRFTYNSIIDPLLALQLNHRMTLLYLRKHLGHPAEEKEEFSELMGQHADVICEGIP